MFTIVGFVFLQDSMYFLLCGTQPHFLWIGKSFDLSPILGGSNYQNGYSMRDVANGHTLDDDIEPQKSEQALRAHLSAAASSVFNVFVNWLDASNVHIER
jgi:hypothetical protein